MATILANEEDVKPSHDWNFDAVNYACRRCGISLDEYLPEHNDPECLP